MSFETIKKRGDFLAANNAKRLSTGTFILQMRLRPEGHPAGPEPRFGFTVTKKMGNAVKRNRIKRRLREAARKIGPLHALAGHDYVLISREKALTCAFDAIERDMEFAFSKIPSMKDSQPRYTKPKKHS